MAISTPREVAAAIFEALNRHDLDSAMALVFNARTDLIGVLRRR